MAWAMSIQAIAWVLENSGAEMGDRLVLLAIANHCDGAGYNAYPSVDQIAVEARVSRRTVFRSLESLELQGDLEVVRNRGRGNRNMYRLPLEKRCQPDTVNPDFTVSSTTLKGATGGTQSRPEPKTLARTPTRARPGVDFWEPERPRLTPGERAAAKERLAELKAKGASKEAVG